MLKAGRAVRNVVQDSPDDRLPAGPFASLVGRELAQKITVDSPTAGQAIIKLDAYLRDNYTYDETAQGGSSLGRLERFLLQDQTGTAEQFAGQRFCAERERVAIPSDQDGKPYVLYPSNVGFTTSQFSVWGAMTASSMGADRDLVQQWTAWNDTMWPPN